MAAIIKGRISGIPIMIFLLGVTFAGILLSIYVIFNDINNNGIIPVIKDFPLHLNDFPTHSSLFLFVFFLFLFSFFYFFLSGANRSYHFTSDTFIMIFFLPYFKRKMEYSTIKYILIQTDNNKEYKCYITIDYYKKTKLKRIAFYDNNLNEQLVHDLQLALNKANIPNHRSMDRAM